MEADIDWPKIRDSQDTSIHFPGFSDLAYASEGISKIARTQPTDSDPIDSLSYSLDDAYASSVSKSPSRFHQQSASTQSSTNGGTRYSGSQYLETKGYNPSDRAIDRESRIDWATPTQSSVNLWQQQQRASLHQHNTLNTRRLSNSSNTNVSGRAPSPTTIRNNNSSINHSNYATPRASAIHLQSSSVMSNPTRQPSSPSSANYPTFESTKANNTTSVSPFELSNRQQYQLPDSSLKLNISASLPFQLNPAKDNLNNAYSTSGINSNNAATSKTSPAAPSPFMYNQTVSESDRASKEAVSVSQSGRYSYIDNNADIDFRKSTNYPANTTTASTSALLSMSDIDLDQLEKELDEDLKDMDLSGLMDNNETGLGPNHSFSFGILEDNEAVAGRADINAGLEGEAEDFGARNETADGDSSNYRAPFEDPRLTKSRADLLRPEHHVHTVGGSLNDRSLSTASFARLSHQSVGNISMDPLPMRSVSQPANAVGITMPKKSREMPRPPSRDDFAGSGVNLSPSRSRLNSRSRNGSLSRGSVSQLKQQYLQSENSEVRNIHDVLSEKFDEFISEELAMADKVRTLS
jgi:hypothetical protein